MATCWNCGAFNEESLEACNFCGADHPEAKPRWIAALDALPGPDDPVPHFGLWYLAWNIILFSFGLWYWPWGALLGAMFISMFIAVPATMLSAVFIQQLAKLWRHVRPNLVLPEQNEGLLALEAQTRARLQEDQEAFDGLIEIMTRELSHQDLLPDRLAVDYRKQKVLPVFGRLVRLSASALLEIDVRRLVNQCEQVCDGIEDCSQKEFNQRYERLVAMQRELRALEARWNQYIFTRVITPEVAALSEKRIDYVDPRLQPESSMLSSEDVARLEHARATLKILRHWLHQTQELQLLKSTRPLAGQDLGTGLAATSASNISIMLKQIQTPGRLRDLESEYQRIVAEQRTMQDASEPSKTPGPVPDANISPATMSEGGSKNPIDAPAVLPNSLLRL